MYHDSRPTGIPHFKSVLIPIVCMKSGFCPAPLSPGGAVGAAKNEQTLDLNKSGLGYLLFPVIAITGNSELNKIKGLRIWGASGTGLIEKVYQDPGPRTQVHGPGRMVRDPRSICCGFAAPDPGRAARDPV